MHAERIALALVLALKACTPATPLPKPTEPPIPYLPCDDKVYTLTGTELPTSFRTTVDPEASCSFTLNELGLLVHGEAFWLVDNINGTIDVLKHVNMPYINEKVEMAYGTTTVRITDEWGLDVTIEVNQDDFKMDIPENSVSGD